MRSEGILTIGISNANIDSWQQGISDRLRNEMTLVNIIFGDIIIAYQTMAKCRLQPIDSYPYDVTLETNPMSLNYTCFTDAASADSLQIISHGFRYLSAHETSRLVLIVLDERLEAKRGQIVLKAPKTILQSFLTHSGQIAITREPIGLASALMPQVEASKEVNAYFNSSFRIDPAIIKFLSRCDFVCQTGEYFIDCLWLQSSLGGFRSLRTRLDWQRALRERQGGRFVSYLRVYIQVLGTREARLFKKGETTLTVKQEPLHPYNLYRTIALTPLEHSIMSSDPYERAFQEIGRQQIKNEIIVLEADQDIGLEGFLQSYAQTALGGNFKCIDCHSISSTKDFWAEFDSISLLESSLVFIRNVGWVEELYQSEQVLNFDLKAVAKRVEQEFQGLVGRSLRQYCVVVEHVGENSIHQHFQNARSLSLRLDRPTRLLIFEQVFAHIAGQHPAAGQIVQQFHDKFGWQVLLEFLRGSWEVAGELAQEELMKQVRGLVKQEVAENLISVSWDDVGGLETAKEEIVQTVLLPIRHPEIFNEQIRPRTGLLFYGPPGTGKTLLGKCVAKECRMSFISVKGPELLNMYVGESEKNVRGVFERARACSPCIVFMDELDALIPKRGNSGDSNQVMDRIVAELLQQMDSAAASQVFVIGATNRPDLLDPSIMRAGRFDKQIYLGITHAPEDRLKIIKAQTRHLSLQQDISWPNVLDQLPNNFTGADFYGLTSKAVMAAAERTIAEYERGEPREKITLREEDFLEAARGIKSSVTEADLARYEQLRRVYS